jgi:ankyrin repeat protein
LHIVCKYCAQVDIIQLLVAINPNAVHASSTDEMLPLHFACSHQKVSCDIIQLLLEQSPSSVGSQNANGQFPLHLACATKEVPLEVVQLLVERAPHITCEKDSLGRLPLHYACLGTDNVEVVSLLVESYPESLRVADNVGCIPLHYAASKAPVYCHESEERAPRTIVQLLLEQYPDGVRRADSSGRLPLHMACNVRNTATLDTIRVRNTATLDTIHHLVNTALHTVLENSRNGDTPLKLACQNRLSRDIKTFLAEKQAEAIHAMREAYNETVDRLLIPDLVVAKVWEFVWQASDEDWLSDDESDLG